MTDTQLANYHLSKFEASISKKAKRRQSAALLLMGKIHSISKSLKFDLNYKIIIVNFSHITYLSTIPSCMSAADK